MLKRLWGIVSIMVLMVVFLVGCSQSDENLLKNYEGVLTDYEEGLIDYERLETQYKSLNLDLEIVNKSLDNLQITLKGKEDRIEYYRKLNQTLQDTVRSKSLDFRALSTEIESLSSLKLEIEELKEEIRDLEKIREPLKVQFFREGFTCTGSMEPKITCLDEGLWLTNFQVEDIVVGTVIMFSPLYGCIAERGFYAHRVVAIKGEGDFTSFRTKGDASPLEEECWIPLGGVKAYLIDLYKNVRMENSLDRNRYNGTMQQYKDLDRRYSEFVDKYCPGYICPPSYYGMAIRTWCRLKDVRRKLATLEKEFTGEGPLFYARSWDCP